MSDLTSEKIAKALKGAGLSSKQRVEKAQEAWTNDAIFFPNKDEFLFEWIGSTFAKPNLKKMDDCCLLQLPYWHLLGQLLQHYGSRQDRSIPTIQVNFVSSLSTLLQLLYKEDGKYERIEFLTVSRECLALLFSDRFQASYRPALEHVSSAVDQVLDALSVQLNLCSSSNKQEQLVLQELCAIAEILLKKFDAQLVLAANQKKIFLSVVEKSLSKLLLVRHRISPYNDTIAQIVTDTICHSLFHADTVLEFTSVLKDAASGLNATTKTNYVVKLFECLDQMVEKQNEDDESVLGTVDILPILLSAFLDSFRKKRNTSTSAMQDISRMAEFGMFTYLLNTASKIKESHVSAYLKTIRLLLQQVLTWNIYTARNDEIGNTQMQLLNTIADDVVDYLTDPNTYDQSLVLDVANTLLQIDFSLIETRIQALWPIMLNAEEKAYASCLLFATSILHTYSASRQIDVYISDLIQHIQRIPSSDLFTVLKTPLFSREFLNEFSSTVSKSMPVAQYVGTFTSFQDSLIANVVTEEEPKRKKSKKETTSVNSKAWRVTLIAMYFVEFIHAMKLSQQQLKHLEAPILVVYNAFVKPSIQHNSNVESTLLPAFQVHSALSSAFFHIYMATFEASELEWLAQSYIKAFQEHKKVNTMISRLVVVNTVNTMLQHAYYATLLDTIADSRAIELVHLVIDFVVEDEENKTWYNTAQWNGSILGLKDKYALKVACWKLLSDEWFESIVRFVDTQRAERLASIIHRSLINEANTNALVSVQLLNKILLRSANFYEAKCFKDCHIPIILNALVELFNTTTTSTTSSASAKAAEMIAQTDVSKPLIIEPQQVQSLTALLGQADEDAMDQDIDTNHVHHISTLLKLLLLFPNECFEKNERLHLVYLATLIDLWSGGAETECCIKVSLMCRGLQLKFIDYFSTHSVLGMDYRVLEWLVSSNTTTRGSTTYKALEQETNRLDFLVLRKIMMSAASSNVAAQSYFESVLANRTTRAVQDDVLDPLIHFLRALTVTLNARKSTEESVIYAKPTMAVISKFVISALETAQSTLSEVQEHAGSSEWMTRHESTFKRIGRLLQLTRLLQSYALTVGPDVDEVIAAEAMSKTLVQLASPFIQCLQATLSCNKVGNTVVLQMTTDFMAAFCSILPRYQHVETTKRVLASVWFVYSLVFQTGDEASLTTLSNAFGLWMQSLTKEQYTILVDSFMEQAEEEAVQRTNVEKEQHHVVYLSLFSLFVSQCAPGEKGRLRKQIPSIVLKLSLIAGQTTNLTYLEQMLKLLVQITGDQLYHMSEYDASVILSCVMQVAHPTASERFKTSINVERANALFIDTCAILSNLISHHKEQVVYMMPPFIGFVQSLFHCFKSSHVSLVAARKRKRDSASATEGRSVALLQAYAPLDHVSAQRFARVLTTLPQKQQQHVTTKSTKNAQAMQKMVAKHTPSLLIEYFTLQSNATRTIVDPSIKSVLTNALYDILDLCSENDRNFVLACLDGSGKSLFKDFYSSWKEHHQYSGQ